MEREGITRASQMTDVMELMLLLPANQFFALEQLANRKELTVAQLLRHAIAVCCENAEKHQFKGMRREND